MDAFSLRQLSDLAVSETHAKNEESLEKCIRWAEREARTGAYKALIIHGPQWISQETRRELLTRGFWLEESTYGTYLHWLPKPGWFERKFGFLYLKD